MTNRMRLLRAANDLQRIKEEPAIGPTPYEHLSKAVDEMVAASRFVLSSEEQEQGPIQGFST